jgi:hypothetical protein
VGTSCHLVSLSWHGQCLNKPVAKGPLIEKHLSVTRNLWFTSSCIWNFYMLTQLVVYELLHLEFLHANKQLVVYELLHLEFLHANTRLVV